MSSDKLAGRAEERKQDLKLLEAGEAEGGKSLIPKAIDADDEDDDDASSEEDSDEEVGSAKAQEPSRFCKLI